MTERAALQTQLWEDPISTEHLNNQSDPNWTTDPDGLLCHLRHIYVLNSGNIWLHVLQYSHDHPLARHFSQMKTLHQVCMQYYWSGLPIYIKDYCKLCTICSQAKCYMLVHCTTQPGARRGFRCWLQLVHCTWLPTTCVWVFQVHTRSLGVVREFGS